MTSLVVRYLRVAVVSVIIVSTQLPLEIICPPVSVSCLSTFDYQNHKLLNNIWGVVTAHVSAVNLVDACRAWQVYPGTETVRRYILSGTGCFSSRTAPRHRCRFPRSLIIL